MKIQEFRTSLPPADVLNRAKAFFSRRVPHMAAFPEKEGPGWLALRGQGGEDIALSATEQGGATFVRGSSLLFGQPLSRFLSTLPPAPPEPA
ncbi:MAG: hypothetical protein ACREL6_00230 [Gemmatimonadales bacterium]